MRPPVSTSAFAPPASRSPAPDREHLRRCRRGDERADTAVDDARRTALRAAPPDLPTLRLRRPPALSSAPSSLYKRPAGPKRWSQELFCDERLGDLAPAFAH